MTRLKDFDANSILLWWSRQPSARKQDLKHIALMGTIHQISPDDLTLPKIRRHVQDLLRDRGYLPKHRAPTNVDYQQAKTRFLNWWYNQTIA